MQVNDKVKPHAGYDFGTYTGPTDTNDRGVVVDYDELDHVMVQWESGLVSDHYIGEDENNFDYAVVPA